MLRVNDVGTKYGPPTDQLDAEVVISLDTEEGRAFGFQLRKDANLGPNEGMLDVLRRAFKVRSRLRVDYVRTGCSNGRIIRVIELP